MTPTNPHAQAGSSETDPLCSKCGAKLCACCVERYGHTECVFCRDFPYAGWLTQEAKNRGITTSQLLQAIQREEAAYQAGWEEGVSGRKGDNS